MTLLERKALEWALLSPDKWDAVPADEAHEHRLTLAAMLTRPTPDTGIGQGVYEENEQRKAAQVKFLLAEKAQREAYRNLWLVAYELVKIPPQVGTVRREGPEFLKRWRKLEAVLAIPSPSSAPALKQEASSEGVDGKETKC